MTRFFILSIFPGIDGLGRGFEEQGDCVVRGPDLLWGGDIHMFHPPACVFQGVIGGPPCQVFSRLRHLNPKCGQKHGNLIPEFERVVEEASPRWFVMENVPEAPQPQPRGYWPARSLVLNNRWLGQVQNRERRFSFGVHFDAAPNGRTLDVSEDIALWESPEWERCVVATSSKEGALAKSQQELRAGTSRRLKRQASALPGQSPRRTVERCAELQGFPLDFLANAPFTAAGKYMVIGNAVPRWMAVAVAKAVHRCLETDG